MQVANSAWVFVGALAGVLGGAACRADSARAAADANAAVTGTGTTGPASADAAGDADQGGAAFAVGLPLAADVSAGLAAHVHCLGSGTPVFDNVTLASGVLHRHEVSAKLPHYHRFYGGGGVLEDLDGDGDLDLYLSNAAGPKRLFVNRGDGHFDLALHPGDWAQPASVTNGVGAADLDGDGRVDLFLANRGPDQVLRNLGGLRFADVTANSGLAAVADFSASASFCDLDGDSDLDVFVAGAALTLGLSAGTTKAGLSRLWRNDGGLHFTDLSASVTPTGIVAGASYLGVCADLDGDGDVDLLHTAEFGGALSETAVYRNDGATPGAASKWPRLTNVTATANVLEPKAVMGATLLDAGGRFDVVLTNLDDADSLQREAVLRPDAALHFVEVGGLLGAHAMHAAPFPGHGPRASSWAALALDVDNDGDEDLHFTYGNLPLPAPDDPERDLPMLVWLSPRYTPGQPDALLLRGADGRFQRRDGACAEDTSSGRGSLVGDLDGDGCLDLITVPLDGPVRVLRNRCETGGAGWLDVSLAAKGANRFGIGAVVELAASAATTAGRGKTVQRRRVLAGSQSVFSALPTRVHFGLGPGLIAAGWTVTVRWPGGSVSQHAVPVGNRRVVIAQP